MRSLPAVLVTLGLSLLAASSAAQTYDTLWTKTYWNGHFDTANCVQETSDRGFIITGATMLMGEANRDISLVRTDSLGEVEWSMVLEDPVHDEAGHYVLQTADGGYLVAAASEFVSAGAGGVRVLRFNSTGDTLWTRVWCPDDRHALPYYAITTAEGDYAITGIINRAGGTFNDAFILRYDDDGILIDAETYGDYFFQDGQYLTQLIDSGFILTGHYDDLYNSGYDYWVLRTDPDLNLIWDSTYAITTGYDEAHAACRVEDGIVLAGTASGVGHVHKIDFDGHTVWSKPMSITPHSEQYNTMVEMNDGGLMVGGYYGVAGHRRDFAFLRLNENGDIEWNFAVGGSQDDHGHHIIKTYDGQFVMTGASFSFVSGSEYYLVKVFEECCEGLVGDANGDGGDVPTIGDISVIADALFITLDHTLVDCLAEADCSQSGGMVPTWEEVTIGDISILVDYLFITGPDDGYLPDCL